MAEEKESSRSRLSELQEQSKRSRELVQRIYEEARRNPTMPIPAGASRTPRTGTSPRD
jgi:hypothetical protein